MIRIKEDYDNNERFLPNMGYCPSCGGTRFNTKTGLCVDCGYDEGDYGYTGTDDYDDLDEDLEESSNTELIKRAQKALNYRLGRGEEYVTVDNAKVVGKTNSGKDIVRVEYSVSVHIPVWTDPETGITEYEDDYEYRTDNIVI